MVGITVDEFTTKIIILGHGLAIAERFELSPGITLEPDFPKVDIAAASASARGFRDYAAAVTGGELPTFSIEVQGGTGPELATKAWNSLWLFHLLSLACSGPCYSLCAIARGKIDQYSAANRNVIFRPLPLIVSAASEQIAWAKGSLTSFHPLISEPVFQRRK